MAAVQETKDLEKLEAASFEESDSFEMPPTDVIAYNELRSCADLVRMYRQGILEIQPEFQREVVWRDAQQTRFIDSLLKQLPIPSMCFSLDYGSQKWQVIDGLQRMQSIINFLSVDDWRLARLDDIAPELSGQNASKFRDVNSILHKYYMRVENLTLPITVVRCDYSKANHMEYLFAIFHRLNSGGAKLSNQEIRNCIFSGPFNDLLRELSETPAWVSLVGGESTILARRYRRQELILRFFAFHDQYQTYKGGLTNFLNTYMRVNRKASNDCLALKRELFKRTTELVCNSFSGVSLSARMSITVLEAVLVGVALNIDGLGQSSDLQLQEMYQSLILSEEFSEPLLREGLAARERVIQRMSVAQRVFSGGAHGG